MFSKIKKALMLLPLGLVVIPSLTSCGQSGDYIYLKVLNSEDYIYKYDPDEGCTAPDLTEQFENYYNSLPERQGQKKVKVVYDTFDTMENMFNTLKTGKTKYDLVCASEYMIQKLAKLDLIVPLEKDKIQMYFGESGYDGYCSPFIRDKLLSIGAKGGTAKKEDKNTLYDYTVCYMWGTLGLIYNPNFKEFKNRGYSEQEVKDDFTKYGWDILWGEDTNGKYKKTISIKDSMRDTYAIGLMHKYKKEFEAETDIKKRQVLFDRGGEDDPDAVKHVNEVKDDLLRLRNNIFGFEVDSGKDDIVTGKIGIDTAWSGDAVYSMDQGDEAKEKVKLYYYIPEIGTNLWFDCWAMQKGANTEVASAFLDFISTPDNAIQNMDYIGYTSPIANATGDPETGTFDYFDDKYGAEEGATTEDYNLNYFFQRDGETDDYILEVEPDIIHRQLGAQFPRIVTSGAGKNDHKFMIMKDYGKNNDLILKMWEDVKHESLPTWAIVIFAIEGAVILGFVTYLVVTKSKDKNRRKARRLRRA